MNVIEFNIKSGSKDFHIFDCILFAVMYEISRKTINYKDISYWFNLCEYDIRLIFFYLFKLTDKRKKIVKNVVEKATAEQMNILKEVQKDINISMNGDIIVLQINSKHKDVIDLINQEFSPQIKFLNQ